MAAWNLFRGLLMGIFLLFYSHSPYNMYVFDTLGAAPAFAFASGGSNSGYDGPVIKYFDLETVSELWSVEVNSFYGMQSLDVADDLFGDGAATLVVATDNSVEYYSTV